MTTLPFNDLTYWSHIGSHSGSHCRRPRIWISTSGWKKSSQLKEKDSFSQKMAAIITSGLSLSRLMAPALEEDFESNGAIPGPSVRATYQFCMARASLSHSDWATGTIPLGLNCTRPCLIEHKIHSPAPTQLWSLKSHFTVVPLQQSELWLQLCLLTDFYYFYFHSPKQWKVTTEWIVMGIQAAPYLSMAYEFDKV